MVIFAYVVSERMAQSTCSNSSELSQLINNSRRNNSLFRQKGSVCPPSLKHLCLPSKAAVLILCWTAGAGVLYHMFLFLLASVLLDRSTVKLHHNNVSIYYNTIPYAVLAVVMMFYPLSGFIADVCCGRMKTIVVSLIVLLMCSIFLLLGLSVLEGFVLDTNLSIWFI